MSQFQRRKCLLIAGMLLVAPLVAIAQQHQQVWRIGCLAVADLAATPQLLDAFRAGLRDHGYVDGQNVVIDCRWAEGTSIRLDNHAADLVRSKVDLILAWSTPAVIAAKRATSTIPIVMVSIADPVGSGFIASLARPGGNITGVTNLDADLAAKRFQLLREVLPKLSQMVALRNATNPSAHLQYKETLAGARSLGIELQFVDVRDPKELEGAFSAMAKSRVSALTVLADPMFISQRKQIADFAIRSRIPTIFARNENTDAGGLMSYGPTLTDQFHHAANYVDKIFKGAKPTELPVERPTRMELVINVKTAKALGLTVPQSLLIRADRVIE
jgi:putative ABC transport system substrate-binding protein